MSNVIYGSWQIDQDEVKLVKDHNSNSLANYCRLFAHFSSRALENFRLMKQKLARLDMHIIIEDEKFLPLLICACRK